MSMIEALNAVRSEAGAVDSLKNFLSDVADEHDVTVERIVDCFQKKYGKSIEQFASEQATAFVLATTRKEEALQEIVRRVARNYGVDGSKTEVREMDGKRYTLLCHLPRAERWGYVAVCHDDLQAYKLDRSAPLKKVA